LFFFFFQAEDGIRDRTVTGVQTCALPISLSTRLSSRSLKASLSTRLPNARSRQASTRDGPHLEGPEDLPRALLDLRIGGRRQHRSEERRVGKEWRCRRERE